MTTISIISAGAMGSALAATLTRTGGLRVLSWLDGRTSGTLERAKASGMEAVPLATIANESRIILSVLPPNEATTLARKIADAATTDSSSNKLKPIYCDLNAVAPETSKKVAEIVKHSFRFVDGCIIGGPPHDSYQPTIYISGDSPEAVHEVESLLGQKESILKVRVLEGQGNGAASALKLSYAGLAKGFTALGVTMVLAAAKQSPETASALIQELSESRPGFLKNLSSTIPGCLPKAYRFEGEMEEIAAYVDGLLERDDSRPGDTYRSIAQLYSRVARDVEHDGPHSEALRNFGLDAKRKLAE